MLSAIVRIHNPAMDRTEPIRPRVCIVKVFRSGEFARGPAPARIPQTAEIFAATHGLTPLYLLTTTAEDFFPRFGFSRITRQEVPESVRASVEFRSACPASAVVMWKPIRR